MKDLKTRSSVGCKILSNFLVTRGFCKTKFFVTSLENDYKNEKKNDCFVLKFSIENIYFAYFPSSVFFSNS